jgi:hypothetical protein
VDGLDMQMVKDHLMSPQALHFHKVCTPWSGIERFTPSVGRDDLEVDGPSSVKEIHPSISNSGIQTRLKLHNKTNVFINSSDPSTELWVFKW